MRYFQGSEVGIPVCARVEVEVEGKEDIINTGLVEAAQREREGETGRSRRV